MNASTDTQPSSEKPAANRRQLLRRLLLWGGPLLVAIIIAISYATGGRYISTENAYVKADKVSVSTQVPGPISQVLVGENTRVEAGQPLFQIDPEPFRLALSQAQARLQSVRDELLSLKAQYRQTQQQLQLANARLDYTQRQRQRAQRLAEQQLGSQATLDDTAFKVEEARQQKAVVEETLVQIRARLGGDPNIAVEEHPLYLEAQTALQQAQLNLEHTLVRAPFAGSASQKPEPGQYVNPGQQIMAIVSEKQLWITANFKETEITDIQPGQPVSIQVDSYPGHTWQGEVESISQATGAEFSILPPQNASGNWVKVVQRIPVRIRIHEAANAPSLRAGMSTRVTIDTASENHAANWFEHLTGWQQHHSFAGNS